MAVDSRFIEISRDGRFWPRVASRSSTVAAAQARNLMAATQSLLDHAQRAPVARITTLALKRTTQRMMRRTQLHHIYVALAVFNMSIVSAALYVNHGLNQALARASGVESGLGDARGYQSFEALIGMMLLFMLCAAVMFGSALYTTLQKRDEKLHTALRSANSAQAKSRALNDDVTKLDTELLENIRKLREAQDEIGRKGRLAQLGQLTATVAHEIRNPLGAIRTAAYLVERKVKDKGLGLEAAMQRISTGVMRCDKIIGELLDFTRSKALTLKSLPMDTWVKTTVEEEAKNLPGIVQFSFDLGLGDTAARFDEDRMRRVLINLLSNASEAMVGRSDDATSVLTQTPRITVKTRCVGNNIEIVVTDNGPGISQENIVKIMEPLFTTKSFGVGLGLPAVEKILQQHGGGLRIMSKPAEGATFIAWFPAAHSERTAA